MQISFYLNFFHLALYLLVNIVLDDTFFLGVKKMIDIINLFKKFVFIKLLSIEPVHCKNFVVYNSITFLGDNVRYTILVDIYTSSFTLRIFDDKFIDIFYLDKIPLSLYTRYMNTIYNFLFDR